MLKRFIVDNWLSIVLLGGLLFLVMENQQLNELVNEVKYGYEEDKERQDHIIDSLRTEAVKNTERIEELDTVFYRTLSEIEKIKNKRDEIDNTIPTYSDDKLDSIISNYRRPRQAAKRGDSINTR